MTVFLAIILLLAIIWLCFGNQIRNWIHRRMMQRMEDIIRRSMGMPSVKEEQKMRKQAEKQNRKSGFRDPGAGTRTHHGPEVVRPDTIIPKEYAEDVDFVEYKDFSQSVEISESDDATSVRTEEQVSDVEYVEIKNKS